MITLEQFAVVYVPIGLLVNMGLLWVIVDLQFKEERSLLDIGLMFILSCVVIMNALFMLWGVSLL